MKKVWIEKVNGAAMDEWPSPVNVARESRCVPWLSNAESTKKSPEHRRWIEDEIDKETLCGSQMEDRSRRGDEVKLLEE